MLTRHSKDPHGTIETLPTPLKRNQAMSKRSIYEFTEAELNAMSVEELEALDTTPKADKTFTLDMDDLLDFK